MRLHGDRVVLRPATEQDLPRFSAILQTPEVSAWWGSPSTPDALRHEMFADDEIVLKPETTAKDIDGWDSFNNLNIMVAVETRFGIKMSSHEIEDLKNIGELVKIVMTKSA